MKAPEPERLTREIFDDGGVLGPDGIIRSAVFSDDRKYRYALGRVWGNDVKTRRAIFALLNPSTADDMKDDPTIRRCMGYAKDWGYDGLWVLNIFALRSTDPAQLKKDPNPVGPFNRFAVTDVIRQEQQIRKAQFPHRSALAGILCGWGAHGLYRNQGHVFRTWIEELGLECFALKVTKSGQPAHPLYLRKDLEPFKWPRWDPC